MTKKIALLVILLLFGFELNAKWTRPVDEEANADKYGFEHDFCPKTTYGHTAIIVDTTCLLYTSPSPRDVEESRMPSSA